MAQASLQPISYESGGLSMTGYLADGSDGERAPGILVAHEAPGMSDHVKRRAEMLAALGYVAFALDLYGTIPASLDEARAHATPLLTIPGLMVERASSALDILADHASVDAGRLAAIGFCQGGIVALELARHGAPIRAAIGFHPGLMRPAESPDGPIAPRVLMMVGNDDPIVPPEARAGFAKAMDAAGADWQLHVYGGVGHSFTNPAVDALGFPGFRYDRRADVRSWTTMLALLDEVFA